jgi:hypothetical protein
LDELAPQTRRLLGLLDEMVKKICEYQEKERCDVHFSRRNVREVTGWGNTQLKLHLQRLVEMEYLVVHPSGHSQRYLYELIYDGQRDAQRPFLMGLIDVMAIEKQDYDANRSGSEGNRPGQKEPRSGTGRPVVGPWSGGGRGVENPQKVNTEEVLEEKKPKRAETALKGRKKESRRIVHIDPGQAQAYPTSFLAADIEGNDC